LASPDDAHNHQTPVQFSDLGDRSASPALLMAATGTIYQPISPQLRSET
jgi:hypothetical protein